MDMSNFSVILVLCRDNLLGLKKMSKNYKKLIINCTCSNKLC